MKSLKPLEEKIKILEKQLEYYTNRVRAMERVYKDILKEIYKRKNKK